MATRRILQPGLGFERVLPHRGGPPGRMITRTPGDGRTDSRRAVMPGSPGK
ncbi:hypothetical protein A176_007292 [Myxococcus hansupus]|uniref:Uncharacterized protein n=1 Tax=Pseudomyxococcus hansupus TaxID=1297742 RepID=A0A0H4X9V9_9BACT|nr:hypothetical protein A176_007292 [Myxococcus hansupus]